MNPDIPYPDPWSPSVHCILPASRGGSTVDRNNLTPAHLRCNQRLGNKLPVEVFIEVAELDP